MTRFNGYYKKGRLKQRGTFEAAGTLFHSKGDKSIPYQQSENFYNEFKMLNQENNVILTLLNDTVGHDDAFIPWIADALTWLERYR